jgi:hypothetical protein
MYKFLNHEKRRLYIYKGSLLEHITMDPIAEVGYVADKCTVGKKNPKVKALKYKIKNVILESVCRMNGAVIESEMAERRP